MKLFLKSSPKEIFDAQRGVGMALIAGGLAEEYKEPVTPAQTEVKWQIFEVGPDAVPSLKAECPICKQGQTSESLAPFRHCKRADAPPAEFAETFTRLRKKVTPRKRTTVPTNSGAVGWLS